MASDGRSSEANVHEVVMLEGVTNVMRTVLGFCYYPDRALDIAVQLMLLNFYCNLTLEDGEEIPDPAPVPPSPSVPSLPSPPSSFLPSYHVSDFETINRHGSIKTLAPGVELLCRFAAQHFPWRSN